MRVPLSKITSGLYTSGGEYVDKKTQKPYKGYYYKLYGKFYVGKTYEPEQNPIEIETKKKAINNPNSFLYNALAGAQQAVSNPIPVKPTKSQNLASIQTANQQGFLPVIGVNLDADNQAIQTNANNIEVDSTPSEGNRYFFRYLVNINTNVKSGPMGPQYRFGEFSNENDYNRAQSDKKYTRAIVKELKVPGEKPVLNRDDLNEAEKRMPGLKRFLGITNEE
jgi:hypothetical protein